jgi:CheY-like chemotaxis protein
MRKNEPRGLILLVEDDEVTALLTRGLLEGHGYAVRRAATGAEALAALRQEVPDLVLLDVVLPDADGRDLLGVILADPALAGLPVVLLSGLPAGQALPPGVATRLEKPFGPVELLATVRLYQAPAPGRGRPPEARP